MFHQSARVQWVDFEKKSHHAASIGSMFKKYALQSEEIMKNVQWIQSNNINVAVGNGWTALYGIIRYCNLRKTMRWFLLNVEGRPKDGLIVDQYAKIPCFDMEDTKEGFHGHTAYGCDLKTPEEILEMDEPIMVRTCVADGDGLEFRPATICVHEPSEEDSTFGVSYDLDTISKFTNVNGMYMFTNTKTGDTTKRLYI